MFQHNSSIRKHLNSPIADAMASSYEHVLVSYITVCMLMFVKLSVYVYTAVSRLLLFPKAVAHMMVL
jgi:hypothetical protein